MSEIDPWFILNRKNSLRYPYSPQRTTFPENDDEYQRNIPILLKSYACLGKKFLNDADTRATIDNENVMRMIRVCEDHVQLKDLDFLSESLRVTSTTTSTIILGGNDFAEVEGLDWNQLLQVVFIHSFSQTKVAVYFVTTRSQLVDVFAIGPCEHEELHAIGTEIMIYLGRVLPDVALNLTFQFRFQIPAYFATDKLFLAYILAVQLHQHGKYLNIDSQKLSLYKWKSVEGFHSTHDNSFGKLSLDSGYSFVVKVPNNDDDGKLKALGWAIVDVPGDGNSVLMS